MSRSRGDGLRRLAKTDPEMVAAIQGIRRSSVARPHGSLKGRNRQNEVRRAITRSVQEHV